jgi:hypothetical protein
MILREPCVVQCRPRPVCRRMTRLAGVRETRRVMYRIRRAVEVGCMTLIATRIHQLVIAIDVTRLTWRRYVRPGQWELGRAVIESRRLPRGGAVTRLAVLAEVARNMIRICCTREICGMTLIAIGEDELIISVYVATLTRHGNVRTRQRQLGCVMIERRRLPRDCRVTCLTVLTEVACDVIRVCCSCKIRGMTLIAARIDELVVAIDVA